MSSKSRPIAWTSEQIWEMEQELDLINWNISGFQPWVQLRKSIHSKAIAAQIQLDPPTHTRTGRPPSPSVKIADVNWLLQSDRPSTYRRSLNRVRSKKTAVRPSRRLTPDSKDLYIDAISSALKNRITWFEDDVQRNEEDPRIDLGWISLVSRSAVSLGHGRPTSLSTSDLALAKTIENDFQRRFGIELGDFDTQVLGTVQAAKLVSRTVGEYFETVGANRFILVDSPGHNALIQGASDVGVKTIEIQHGVIGKYNLGYSWPGNKPQYGIPDLLFSFGSYWIESTPLANKAVITGAPWLPQNTTEDHKQESMILFMSQGPIGKPLHEFAVKVAKALPRKEIIFHLHPSEILETFEDLTNKSEAPSNFQISEGTVGKVYELMKRATINAGVYSTTLFEGMAMNGRTIIVRLPGAEYMDEAIARGDAIIVDTPEEFIDRIDEAPYCSNPDDYYAPPVLGKDLRSLIKNC